MIWCQDMSHCSQKMWTVLPAICVLLNTVAAAAAAVACRQFFSIIRCRLRSINDTTLRHDAMQATDMDQAIWESGSGWLEHWGRLAWSSSRPSRYVVELGFSIPPLLPHPNPSVRSIFNKVCPLNSSPCCFIVLHTMVSSVPLLCSSVKLVTSKNATDHFRLFRSIVCTCLKGPFEAFHEDGLQSAFVNCSMLLIMVSHIHVQHTAAEQHL